MSFDLFTWLSLHEAWSLFQNSLKPLYSETVSDSAVPCYNQIHISKLVSQPSYTIRNSSSEVGRRVSGHESGNARRELLGSLSLSHEVDGVAQCYWLRASLWMLINKLMVPLIYFNHFFVIFKTAMNNQECWKWIWNELRVRKQEVKLEGYSKSPREPWQALDQGSSEDGWGS